MENIKDILHRVWGYASFRPGQEQVINAVMEGKDALVLMPTGGGKSLCYQVPGIALEGTCLVISPLIALMKDQIDRLNNQGVSSACLYSSLQKHVQEGILDSAVNGLYKFLYVSPERLKSERFLERLKYLKISLVAIDEAHCISQWGHDFRPAYNEIGELKLLFPHVPFMALTATATLQVQHDIVDSLHLKTPLIQLNSYVRENLSYSVFKLENKIDKLLSIIKGAGGTGLVYLRSRKKTEEIARALNNRGVKARAYHAGILAVDRTRIQNEWMLGNIQVMVATNAFGMGIDKGDVRYVVHFDLPDDLESYYQEAGRAGRDGQKAYAVLMYDNADLTNLSERIEASVPSAETVRKVYHFLANMFQLAVGSGKEETYIFSIDSFVTYSKINANDIMQSFRWLERLDYLKFNAAMFEPSRVQIKVSYNTLYEFQLKNERCEQLIKWLLRYLGGDVYNNMIFINEEKVAKSLQVGKTEVIRLLEFMNKAGVLLYARTIEQPSVTYLQERQKTETLFLDEVLLKKRKKLLQQKAQHVIEYASSAIRCRSSLLVEYFGEQNAIPCGICDHCIEQKKKGKQLSIETLLLLLSEAKTIEELKEEFLFSEEEELLACIRTLDDQGLIIKEGVKWKQK